MLVYSFGNQKLSWIKFNTENLWMVDVDIYASFTIIKNIKSYDGFEDSITDLVQREKMRSRASWESPDSRGIDINLSQLITWRWRWWGWIWRHQRHQRWWSRQPPCTESQLVCWQGREVVRLASHRESPERKVSKLHLKGNQLES